MSEDKKSKTHTKTAEVIPASTGSSLRKRNISSSVSSNLSQYLRYISNFPILTKEQEQDIAIKYYETKQVKFAEQLVKSNLRFVIKIAREYSRFSNKIMDIIQEGNLGLMKAVKDFNPHKGTRLITYAVWWIRGYIQEYLIRQHSIVRIGTNKKERKLFYLLQKERDKFEQFSENKLLPAMSEDAQVPIKDLQEMKERILKPDVSLDQHSNSEGGSTLYDVKGVHSNMEDTFSDEQQKSLLRYEIQKMQKNFSEKENYVINNRLLAETPQTLQSIAQHFNVSKEAIRQTEERLLKKLKDKLVPILKKPY